MAYTANHWRASVDIGRLLQLTWRQIRIEDAFVPRIVDFNHAVGEAYPPDAKSQLRGQLGEEKKFLAVVVVVFH